MVIFCHRSLTFKHLNVDCGLIVLICREDLRFLCWDDSVPVDQLGHHTTDCFNAKCERSDIEEEQILAALTTEDASLHCSSISHCLIRVDTTIWFLAVEEILDELLHLRDSGRSTNKDNFINLSLLQSTVFHDLLHWSEGILEQIVVDLLKSSSSQSL
jgi:hypothetical protein